MVPQLIGRQDLRHRKPSAHGGNESELVNPARPKLPAKRPGTRFVRKVEEHQQSEVHGVLPVSGEVFDCKKDTRGERPVQVALKQAPPGEQQHQGIPCIRFNRGQMLGVCHHRPAEHEENSAQQC